MIKIEKEPPDMFKNTGIHEKCVFCNYPTDTWHKETNTPVCIPCSLKHETIDIPSK